jgi:hypothetical protein
VSVVSCKCVFAYAAITATCTAPGSARRSAGASRYDGRKLDISEPVAVRGATPPGNAGGASGNGKKHKM